jgi:putative heme-binding domain-containing protein
VKNQRTLPRFELPIAAAEISADKRTVILKTAARTEAVSYGIALPDSINGGGSAVDLQTDLTGVEAAWQPSSGTGAWTGWLPHLDLAVARAFTSASAEHKKIFSAMNGRGTLVLRAKLDLWQMLHPATQPDSKLDYEYPPETVTVVFKANMKLQVTVGGNTVKVTGNEACITTQPKEYRWLPIEVTLATSGEMPGLDVSWFTAEDSRARPFPLRRVMLPWARPYVALATVASTPEIDGGNWMNGRKIFFSEPAACSKCHKIGGEGGTIGPDLSNLIFRDYASVLKDINEPSAAINPDHISYVVTLTNGETESGVLVKNNHEQVVLGQVTGKDLTIPKEQVASLKASTVSVMPEGLLKPLSAQEQRDLMTFLLNVH